MAIYGGALVGLVSYRILTLGGLISRKAGDPGRAIRF